MVTSILPVYKRSPLEIERGEGVYIYTKDGRRYLDFTSGIAVNCLGHCHPKLVKALQKQAEKLWHVSNLYQIPGMQELADKISKNSFADTMFFCNSGAEAIECLIKSVRKYHDATGNPERYRIITFEGAFHGRTLAAIWASKRDKMLQEGFGPEVPGFDHIPFNDIEEVKKAITNETGAILVEPIQGDGGIREVDKNFIKDLRKLADERGLLLCFDEIQTGIGRSGKFFAHELYGVKPDIVSSAKGIGGGFPLGACLFSEKAAVGMTLGTHGSTYGGNPLAMAVGNAVIDEVLKPGFMDNITKLGKIFKKKLEAIAEKYPNVIAEVRGIGFILGIKCVPNNKEVGEKLETNGLMLPPAGENVLRILPPLISEEAHIDEALAIIERVCKEY